MSYAFLGRTILTLVLLAVLFVPGSTLAEEPTVWIDLDGDGFDDNAVDNDEDGIPDSFGSVNRATLEAPAQGGVFADLDLGQTAPAALSLSLRYDKLQKLTKAQCATRCDLESGFGSGFGSGVGGGGGGACAGGVCF